MINYSDYHGPQGDYAVIDGRLVACDHDVARRLAQNAHLLALGDPAYAAEMTAAAKREPAGTHA